MIQGPLNLDCLWIFTLFTDVRWVIETSTICNELYPGQECRWDQLQSAESFSRILRTKTFAYLLITVCLRDSLLATFAFAGTPMAFFVAVSPVKQKSFSEMHIPDRKGINFYMAFTPTFDYHRVRMKRDQDRRTDGKCRFYGFINRKSFKKYWITHKNDCDCFSWS